jgi:putative DNA methylase
VIHSPGIGFAPCDRWGQSRSRASRSGHLGCRQAANIDVVTQAGTVRDGQLVYNLALEPGGEAREWRIPIARLRGDGEGPPVADGTPGNRLRLWTLRDVAPVEPEWDEVAAPMLARTTPGAWSGGDILLERLLCIQGMDGEDLRQGKTRPTIWFAAPETEDLDREARLRALVEDSIVDWQASGLVPDMRIEPGEERLV